MRLITRGALAALCCLVLAACSSDPKKDPNLIQPDGAPFSFQLPTGFTEQPELAQRAIAGSDTSVTKAAAVAIDGFNSITVVSYPLDKDAKDYTRQELVDQLSPLVANLQGSDKDISAIGDPGKPIPAGRALHFSIQDSSSNQASDFFFVFAGKHEVEVVCQFQDKSNGVSAGCTKVLDTLAITA